VHVELPPVRDECVGLESVDVNAADRLMPAPSR
jgi:hypothetical protein